jgi:hypothetical protein
MLGSQAAQSLPSGKGIANPAPRSLNPSPSSGLGSKLTFVNTRVGPPARWQSSRHSTAESSTRRSCVETLRSRGSMP